MYKVYNHVVSFSLLILFFMSPLLGMAQCDMYCNGVIQVGFNSEDAGCTTEMQLSELLRNKDEPCNLDVMDIYILDESGNQVLSNEGIIEYDWVGRKLQYMVVDAEGKNNCWGYLEIEDKKKPILSCNVGSIVDLFCFESIDTFITNNIVAEDCDDQISYDRKVSLRQINRCDGNLSDEILEEYVASIVATDSWGNVSDPCDITFRIMRITSLEDIDIPESMSLEDGDFLSCYQNIPTDEKGMGYPSPTAKEDFPGTGVPEFEGIPIFPNSNQFCNLWVDYEDNLIKEGCKTKIVRNWIITENACNNEGPVRRLEVPQIIYIVDDKGPSIEALQDLKLSTGYTICGQILSLNPPMVSDTCGTEVNLSLNIEGGLPSFYPMFDDYTEIILDTGINQVIFIATDACDNTTMDTMMVAIHDDTPPSMICKTYTVTSLVDEGVSMVHASSFDNGTKDECKLDRIEVKRMDNGVPCGIEESDTEYDEYVGFCCADIGQNVMIMVRAYDKAGNISECMVEVRVQDKIPAYIVCPPDISVKCGIDYSDLSIFGEVRKLYSDIETFEIDPDYFVSSSGVLKDGYAIDNCDFEVSSVAVEKIDNCGAGTIIRKFYIESDGVKLDSCNQTITLVRNPAVFAEMEVSWPSDTMLLGCISPDDDALRQENTGRLEYIGYGCQMIGVTTGDEVYNFSGTGNGSCFKIIRKWNIIDWCAAPDVRGDYPTKTNTQIIKVVDTLPPTIIGEYPDRVLSSYDPDCSLGPLSLKASAMDDDCGTDLRYFYEIYRVDEEDRILQSAISNGDSIDTVIDYPLGSYIIKYVFLDRCGNQASVSEEVQLINAKAPTPYAYNGLAIDMMGIDTTGDGLLNTGMAEIWASDFDAGSNHPCDLPIILSFSSDTSDQVRIYGCDSVGRRQVEIWATIVAENGDLIQNYTHSSIDIQDNLNQCGGNGNRFTPVTLDITGNIYSSTAHPIMNSIVNLEGSDMEYLTNEGGVYAFPPMPAGGSYNIVPSKNDDILNGVNTLDLVKIQRHLLGITPFDSPFQLIAGDVNNDKMLSATDILELRKVILGINKEFNSNHSWRFIDNHFSFPELDLILEHGFPENYEIADLQSNMKVDFTGIKVGDVDGDHVGRNLRNIQPRSVDQIELIAKSKDLEDRKTAINIYAQKDMNLLGVQLEFLLSNKLIEISSGQLNVSKDLFHYNHKTRSLLISYSSAVGMNITGDKPLFTIVVDMNNYRQSTSLISLNNSHLNSEWYTVNDGVKGVGLELIENYSDALVLKQNQPNPFNQITDIHFNLPKSEQITLSVFDVTGRVIVEKNGYYNKGENTIRLTADEITSSGLLYYQVKANNQVATRKMILIK